jgi:hypothetical protein
MGQVAPVNQPADLSLCRGLALGKCSEALLWNVSTQQTL